MVHLITMAGGWPSATANVKPPCLTATARKPRGRPLGQTLIKAFEPNEAWERPFKVACDFVLFLHCACLFSLRNPVTAVSFRPVSAIINRPWTPRDERETNFSFCAFVWRDREKSSLKFKLHDAWHLGFFCSAALNCWILFRPIWVNNRRWRDNFHYILRLWIFEEIFFDSPFFVKLVRIGDALGAVKLKQTS